VKTYPKIYSVVRQIPRGRLATYGQIARLAGLAGHARQVGYALHALLENSDVPWQRVINARGEISLRSDPYSHDIQRQLLEEEGVFPDLNGRYSLSRYGWKPDQKESERAPESVDMETIYRSLPPDEIPWNRETPPEAFREIFDNERVKACSAVDLGCGLGHYALWLAQRGFTVTGIDVSETAIRLARQNAARQQVDCDFRCMDLSKPLEDLIEKFDFAFDWELLHHMNPEQRSIYVRNVASLLNPSGRYLSLCFSEKDPQFGGSGKYRETSIGTRLYFSSEEELRILFASHFQIIEMKTISIPGKRGSHQTIRAFMRKV